MNVMVAFCNLRWNKGNDIELKLAYFGNVGDEAGNFETVFKCFKKFELFIKFEKYLNIIF